MYRVPPVPLHMSSPISVESTRLSFWLLLEGYFFVSKAKTYTYLRQQAGDTKLFLIQKPSAKTESLIDQPIYCLLSTFLSLEGLSIVSFIWKEDLRIVLEGLFVLHAKMRLLGTTFHLLYMQNSDVR